MDQLSGLQLTSINYVGVNVGGQFNITINAGSETTTLNLTLNYQNTLSVTEVLSAVVVNELSNPYTLPVNITAQSTLNGATGTGGSSFMVPAIGEQTYSIQMFVSQPFQPSAVLTFNFKALNRIFPPYIVPFDNLCLWPIAADAYVNWLCAGRTLPDYNTISEVLAVGTVIDASKRTFDRVNTFLGTNFVQTSQDIGDRMDYAVDVTSAAVYRSTELSWRDRWSIGDFQDNVEFVLAPYVGMLNDRGIIAPVPSALCKKWWDLLHCFCRICALRGTLAPEVVSYYDSNAAPLVNSLYTTAMAVATNEGLALAYPIHPPLTDQCAKLRFILNLFERRCRGRRCIFDALPVNDNQLDAALGPIGPVRDQLQIMLDQLGVYICTQKMKDLCDKWTNLYTCLSRLCSMKANFPSDVASDFTGTFGNLSKQLCMALRGICPFEIPTSDPCRFLALVDMYFQTACRLGYLPGYWARYSNVDSLLSQLITALNGFKNRWGDLCADTATVPQTDCDDWHDIIACLRRLCSHKFEAVSSLITTFINELESPIDSLYDLLLPEGQPDADNPGSLGVDIMCAKLAQLQDWFDTFCAGSRSIDPLEKLKLDRLLADFRDGLAALQAILPELCQDSVSTPSEWCDTWKARFDCLLRFCSLRGVLDPDVVQAVLDLLSDEIAFLDGLCNEVFGDDFCSSVDRVGSYLIRVCEDGTIDPILKQLMDEHLSALEQAYMEAMTLLPGLCSDDSFCDDWAEMLECLRKLCARISEVPGWLVTEFLNYFSGPMDDIFYTIFGYYPGSPQGSIERLCEELAAVQEYLLGACGAGGDVELDQAINVVIEGADIEIGTTLRAYLQTKLGQLMPLFRTIQGQLLNIMIGGGPGICHRLDLGCEAFAQIPAFLHLLCCAPQPQNFSQLTPVVSIDGWLDQMDPFVSAIALRMGLDPAEIGPAGSSICQRLRYVLEVFLLAFAAPALLTALQRAQLQWYYSLLEAYMAQYALTIKDLPRECNACTEACGTWMEMLRCLCGRCNAADLDGNALLCANIDALFTLLSESQYITSFLIDSAWPRAAVRLDPNEATCCEKLQWILPVMATLCMQCDRTLYNGFGLDALLEGFTAAYNQYMAGLPGGEPATCDGDCGTWISMFECIVRLGLYEREIPSWLHQQIAGVLSGLVDTVHLQVRAAKPLPDTMPLTNPVPTAFDTIYWKSLEILRGLYWLCSPYCLWNPMARANLMAQLPAFQAAYATVTSMLAESWINVCSRTEDDPCVRLNGLADIHAAFCTVAQVPNAAPITVVDQLITGMNTELVSLAAQLGVVYTPPATNAPFCTRLASMLAVVAAGLARYEELARRHQLMIRFILSVVNAQASDYRTLLGDRLSTLPTPISEFRRNWLEVLACVCATCNRVRTMSTAERTANTAVINALNVVLADIHSLYSTVISLAGPAGLPLIADLCLESGSCGQEDLCGKLRVVIAFFASYCLGCSQLADQPPVDAVTLLKPVLTTIRTKVVTLRSVLATSGLGLCPEKDPGPMMIQSDYLYLQAVGSTGADGSAQGVHLRWTLLGDPGSKHLPKGNLAAPNATYYTWYGYNKADDFVKIYRTAYNTSETYPVLLDLLAENPADVYQLGSMVVWTYRPDPARPAFLAADPMFPATSHVSIAIRFTDAALYNALTFGRSPKTSQADRQVLFSGYTQVIEIEPLTRPFFRLHVEATATLASPEVKVEAISQILVSDDSAKAQPVITARRALSGATGWHDLFVENARFARVRMDRCWMKTIKVETCQEYYFAVDRRYGWEHFDDFALSTDDSAVRERLEDSVRYLIHGCWPKYNDALPGVANGLEKASVCNYWERWNPWTPSTAPAPYPAMTYGCIPHGTPASEVRSGDALRDAVVHYLTESAQPYNWNPPMNRPSTDTANKTHIELGVLDALKLAAQDFHVARMLGLGTIDWQVPTMSGGPSQRYVYMAEYTTPIAMEYGQVPAWTVHRYLSLPTSQQDTRLPVAPQFSTNPLPLQFGLETNHPDAPPFTDGQGYTTYGDGRFVRLYKAPMVFDVVLSNDQFDAGTFFNGPEFSRADNTRPIQFGLHYYRKNGNAFNLVLPEIANDDDKHVDPAYIPFTDPYRGDPAYPLGYPEPMGVPEPETGRPFFVHHIVKPADPVQLALAQGLHKYGAYGINWFSRVSPVTVMTDDKAFDTTFPKRNTMLPPSNFTAQYIQEEKPLVLTSKYEQDNIATLGGKTRVLFEWNNVQHTAYQVGKRAEFFFRDAPLMVKGQIKGDPVVLPGDSTLLVTVDGVKDYSSRVPGGSTLLPAVPDAGYAARFVGSVFATRTEKFIVVSVSVSATPIGNGDTRHRVLSFVLKRGYTIDSGGTKHWFEPKKNEYFVAAENMNVDGPWTQLSGCNVDLIDFPDNYTEQDDDGSGNIVTRYVGGLYRAANIADAFAGDPTKPRGLYIVTFTADVLSAYSGATGAYVHQVDWYGGTARIADATGAIRTLPVTRIDMASPATANKTVIYVFDSDTASGGTPLQTGAAQVNFHPGYRVYLDLPGAGIDVSRILPGDGEITRNTLLAARSVDPSYTTPNTSEYYHSALTPAAVHLARRTFTLLRPSRPDGGRYATRPNVYGKSSYSFDTTLATVYNSQPRDPYALMFYRINQLDILRALYRPQTVRNILNDLPAWEIDEHFDERWQGLVDFHSDSGAYTFMDYGDGIVFPAPDNPDYETLDEFGSPIRPFMLNRPIDQIVQYMGNVFDGVAFPLAERVVQVSTVTEDALLITSPKPPVLRDIDGQLLDHNDPEYDPAPMIRRKTLVGSIVVRFTDYTLDGATSDFYFYAIREVDETMASGPLSLLRGPVRLVNAHPCANPEVVGVTVTLDNSQTGRTAEVEIEVAPYLAAEQVTTYRLYRTFDADATWTTQAMTLVDEFTASASVWDDFANVEIPYGSPIYYRLVALRGITNEYDEAELIASAPSDVIVANVMDARVPAPPAISKSPDSPSGDPLAYGTLTLTWPQTTYKGTYILYRMDTFGNWVEDETFTPVDPNSTMSQQYTNVVKEVDGVEVLYHFKVVVINSSGITNIEENILEV
ncbi:MAG: hypothetical protein JST22_15305 [Bacteroidetes bacterium]|nr:hypothetical protein [Bacteroidota bacterium]